jgi:hypothetical protein
MAEHTIQATFGFDTKPGQKDLDDFISKVRNGAQHMDGFGSKFESFFKRDPARPAGRAFEELARNLASGDTAQAVTSFVGRIGGIGLAATLVTGVAAGAFKKFTDQMLAADKATRDLNTELAKPPAAQGALSAEGVKAQIDGITKATRDYLEQEQHFFPRVVGAFQKGGITEAAKAFLTGGRYGASDATKLAESFERTQELSGQLAATESETVKVRETGLKVSERQGAIRKTEIDSAAKIAEVELDALRRREELTEMLAADEAKRKLGFPGYRPEQREEIAKARERIGEELPEREEAIRKDAQLTRDAALDTIDAKDRQVAADQKLANLEKDLTDESTVKLTKLEQELKLIQDKLALTRNLTEEEKAAIRVAETRATTAVRAEAVRQFFHPGEVQAQQTAQALERERQKVVPQGFRPAYPGQMPYRDISGRLAPSPAYQTHPDAYGQTGAPSEPSGHPSRYQLDDFKRHMDKLAPGITTGTPMSEDFRRRKELAEKAREREIAESQLRPDTANTRQARADIRAQDWMAKEGARRVEDITGVSPTGVKVGPDIGRPTPPQDVAATEADKKIKEAGDRAREKFGSVGAQIARNIETVKRKTKQQYAPGVYGPEGELDLWGDPIKKPRPKEPVQPEPVLKPPGEEMTPRAVSPLAPPPIPGQASAQDLTDWQRAAPGRSVVLPPAGQGLGGRKEGNEDVVKNLEAIKGVLERMAQAWA